MVYVYDPGTNVPVAAGMVEFADLRINNGTFKTRELVGVKDSPDIRATVTPQAAYHGEWESTPFYNARNPVIELTVYTPDYRDLMTAIESLTAAFNLDTTRYVAMYFRYPGWAQRRFARCRLAGSIGVEEPSSPRRPWRDVQIPLRAPDPRLYSETLKTVTLDPDTAISSPLVVGTNAGNFQAPHKVRFRGPFNSIVLQRQGSLLSMGLDVVVASGVEIELDTLTKTVKRVDTGANYFQYFTGTWFDLWLGNSTFQIEGSGFTGTTLAEIFFRDTWIG